MAAKKVVRTGAESKMLILDTGAKLASKHGAKNVTRRMVAKAAKVAESLVTHYMGGAVDAQKKYSARARKLGLALPTEAQADAIGKKLRAHKPGDARDTRKRSPKEKLAVAKKAAGKVPAKKSASRKATTTTSASTAGKPAPKQNKSLPGPAQNKSAARAPMPAPVSIPALPDVDPATGSVTIPALPN